MKLRIKYYIFLLSSSVVLSITSVFAQTVDPCDAPELTVAPTAYCSMELGSMSGAGNIPAGVPNPGCANYQTGKWYTVTVPTSGNLTITMKQVSGSSFANGGMALYSASSCNGPFTLITCDDDSGTGLMPKVSSENLTPGQLIYVRVWRSGGGVGQFSICAQEKKCQGGLNEEGLTNGCFDGQTMPFCFSNNSADAAHELEYCSPAGSGTSIGSYNCLASTPNPTWFHLKVQTSGSVTVQVSQTSNSGGNADVDFAIYGPYDDVAQGCAMVTATPHPTPLSCSFSGSSTETITIDSAIVGKVYILLVTNYSGQAGTFQFKQIASHMPPIPPPPGSPPGTPPTPYPVAESDCSFLCEIDLTVSADTCGQGVGNITIESIQGTPVSDLLSDPNLSISWDTPNEDETFSVSGLLPGDYTVTVSTSGCTDGSVTVTIPDIFTVFTATYTLVSCPNGADGTATIDYALTDGTSLPSDVTATYLWDDPLAQTTKTAVGLTGGTYTCTVVLSNGCQDVVTVVVDELLPMIASFADSSNVTCYTKNDGMLHVAVSQGTYPYTYVWDNSISTDSIAKNLYVGTHTVTITDANNCTIAVSETLTEPDSLAIIFVTNDTLVCPNESIQIAALGTGGSSTYEYTWTSNGQIVGVGQQIFVSPIHDTTIYCVKLSEACGSPTTDTCLTIVIPEPVLPSLVADIYESCKPGMFHIQNTSSNSSELYSTHIDFGNNTQGVILEGGDTTVVYNSVGLFDLTVSNTSIYGCVYTTVLKDFFQVYSNPIAHFYVAGNPTTVFETTLQAHQLSSNDVVQWEWLSPYSEPQHSNSENPIFSFPDGVVAKYPVTLIVTSYYGCVDTVTLDVIVEDAILFYVPNTFTPDGDPYNQTWRIVVQGGDMHDFSLQVIDRWGELIWQTTDPNQGWDGRLDNGQMAKAGTYTWKAHIKHRYDDGRDDYNGIVNVLR